MPPFCFYLSLVILVLSITWKTNYVLLLNNSTSSSPKIVRFLTFCGLLFSSFQIGPFSLFKYTKTDITAELLCKAETLFYTSSRLQSFSNTTQHGSSSSCNNSKLQSHIQFANHCNTKTLSWRAGTNQFISPLLFVVQNSTLQVLPSKLILILKLWLQLAKAIFLFKCYSPAHLYTLSTSITRKYFQQTLHSAASKRNHMKKQKFGPSDEEA